MKTSTKLFLMTAMLLGAAAVSYFFHAMLGQHTIFTHLFYIPVIMAILWWGRKGFLVIVYLGAILLASHKLFMESVSIQDDLIRVMMFIFIGLVTYVQYLSLERSRKRLSASEARFRNLFESMGDGVIICETDPGSQEFIIKDINPAGKDISKLDNVEYQNRRIQDVFPGAPNTRLMDAMHQVRLTGKPVHIPDTFYRDSRTSGWRTRYLFRLPTGEIVCMYRDVTERKNTEKGLLLLANAIKQTCEAVIIVNEKGVIEFVNQAFENMTGYASNEVIGQKPGILRNEAQDEIVYDKFRDVIKMAKPWSGRLIQKRKDNTLFEVQATISPVKVTEETLNFIFVQRDITEEIKAEKALRQAQKIEAIGTLAGGIAHDLNNILFPIMGHAELAMEYAPDNRKVISHLDGIIKASQRAKDLVRQILTFCRASDMLPHPVQIQPVIKEAVKFLRASIPSSINIVSHIEESCGPILADPSQIYQVVINLCTNALDAVKKTGGSIQLSVTSIKHTGTGNTLPRGLAAGRYACLKITDNGEGMQPDVMEHIFNPFFTTKKIGEGTGLGLSIVHGIVQKHNGLIEVSSKKGQGTTFEIYFPIINALTEIPTQPPFRETLKNSGHILLVEDDEMVCRAEILMLETAGYQITAFRDPIEAIEAFNETPKAFDVVVTDYNMPQLSGTELAHVLKEIRPDIPILMLSGLQEIDTDDAPISDVIDRLAAKPITRRELTDLIEDIMYELKTEKTSAA